MDFTEKRAYYCRMRNKRRFQDDLSFEEDPHIRGMFSLPAKKKRRRKSNPIALGIVIAASLVAIAFSVALQDKGAETLVFAFGGFAAICMGGVFYLLPSIIAFERKIEYRWPLLAINFWLGVSIIGWIACFIWSLTARDPTESA